MTDIKNRLTGFADEIANELDVQVASVKKLGISHIEMRGVDGNNLIYHTDEKVKYIKNYLDDNGISLSALGSPLGKIGIQDAFEPHFEAFKRAVEVGHMMETKNIRMFSFYIPQDKPLSEYEEAVFDRMGKFVDYAKKNDAVLLHENEKGIYGEKASECKKLMDCFYGDNFKAIFDFANFVQAKDNTLEGYKLLKPYISYIHIKDALWDTGEVVPAGLGDGNVKEILKDLNDSGFAGYLSIEPHLSDFTGFSSLEGTGRRTLLKEGKKLSGFEAFELAYNSLLDVLR